MRTSYVATGLGTEENDLLKDRNCIFVLKSEDKKNWNLLDRSE